jgi:hypothetical protein
MTYSWAASVDIRFSRIYRIVRRSAVDHGKVPFLQ